MEKAKEFAREVIEDFDLDSENKRTFKEFAEIVKPEINNFLHVHLPNSTTIKDAEILSIVILDMLWSPHDYTRITNNKK